MKWGSCLMSVSILKAITRVVSPTFKELEPIRVLGSRDSSLVEVLHSFLVRILVQLGSVKNWNRIITTCTLNKIQ